MLVTTAYTMNKWSVLPPQMKLSELDVHVWLINLDTSSVDSRELAVVLSPDEHQRADRFRFPHDRDRYIVGRGQLRLLLGRYLNCHPSTLKFQYTQYGKPALTERPELRFNVSHAGSHALFGFALNREIGIDIEFIKSDFDVVALARHFFSELELDHLISLPIDQRRDAFFTCWTRKESYIKARGEGLSLPLHQFDVSLMPAEPAQLIATRPVTGEASRWKMTDLVVPDGYKAALIVEGYDWQLSCWGNPELSVTCIA